MAKRRTFSPEFKAQAVLEVLTGAKSGAQVCREYRIKDTILSRWKQEFIERSPQLFERGKAQSLEEERIAELERLVGQLTMELQAAKKASLLLASRQNGSKPW
jgi:transposase-like protein